MCLVKGLRLICRGANIEYIANACLGVIDISDNCCVINICIGRIRGIYIFCFLGCLTSINN